MSYIVRCLICSEKKWEEILLPSSQVLSLYIFYVDSSASGYKIEEPVLHLLFKTRAEKLNLHQSAVFVLWLICGKNES